MIEVISSLKAMKFYYFNNIVEERIRRLSKDFFDRMVNNRDFVLKEKEKLIVVVFFLSLVSDTFTFASRRHTDYPFAFAFYLNGVIKDRLSVCCESRCQNYTPVGGKKALIAIVKIENTRPCRRCRYEQRITKLLELEKIAPKESFIKKNIERVRSRSKSPSRQTDKPKVPPHHSPSPSPPPPPIPKRSPTNSKSNFSHKRTQELSSEGSSPEPPIVTRKSPTNNKTNFSHQRAEEVSSDESPSVTLPKNSSPSLTVINGKQPGSTFNYTKPSNQNLDSDG